ncbi:MAG: class I SAM-dependent methyltransferase [Kineosporiaceae bacterium]|nr:class I SAM-dependent methyltransferase [Kineosporiaceae bacterium]
MASRVAHWDKQAPSYDRRTSALERRIMAASRGWVGRRARGATLEIAVGTGANFSYYPPEVTLTGVDFSPAMLQLAGRRAADLDRAVPLHQADAAALPFADASFDSVVCTFAMCCVPDEKAALFEAIRVLRPGGDLLLADHVVASSVPVRVVQQLVELVTVPLHGEHFTRRPLTVLRGFEVQILDAERLTMGAIERVQARKPA